MSPVLSIGLFLLWQLAMLWGALRLVRFAGGNDRLPRDPRVPQEFATGEWREGVDPIVEPTGWGG